MNGFQKPKQPLEHAARSLTRWIGSTQSIAVHTLAFVVSFGAVVFGFLSFDRMLLVLTTVVSLEAIYLAIFIQMTVNRTTESLSEVEQDIGEIQEDVGEIQEDIDELQEDVEEMSEEEQKEEERKVKQKMTLDEMHAGLRRLLEEVERLQKRP